MIQVIHVEPLGQGWAVRHEPAAPPQVFASGAKAEDAALSLGARLAEAGRSSEIRIYLRGGALGGRYVYPAGA
jgi:hypothetical protein